MVELLMSMHTQIINLDAGNLITFKEILAILSLIYKHYKRDFLQNNGITTKNLNLGGCHRNMPTVCLSVQQPVFVSI